MDITGVDFVVLPVDDFEAAAAFYEDTLGLTRSIRYGDYPGLEFETGDLTIAIMDLRAFGGSVEQGTGAVMFRVPDVGEAKRELEGKGVSVSEIIDSGVCHQAFFADPSGNKLGLHHRYSPRA